MQKVELSQESVVFIHCPFCGQAVMGEEMAPEVNPCPHTLFLGTDEGFEFASDFFQSACEKQLEDGYDSMNVHDAIATVKLPDAICFTLVAPPVSMLNCHAAFIGFDQDE